MSSSKDEQKYLGRIEKGFIIHLYKHYIRLKNSVDKIRYRTEELDTEDYEVLKTIFEDYLKEARERS